MRYSNLLGKSKSYGNELSRRLFKFVQLYILPNTMQSTTLKQEYSEHKAVQSTKQVNTTLKSFHPEGLQSDQSYLMPVSQEGNCLSAKPQRKGKLPYKSGRKNYLILRIQILCDRYFINLFKEDFQRIIAKVQMMNKVQKINHYSNESAAVVVANQYQDQIRFHSTRQFCTRNGLIISSFNKKHKIYYYLFIRDKLGDKFHPCLTQSTEDYYPCLPGKKEPEQLEAPSPTVAFSIIYDMLFKNNFFQINRRQVIENVIVHYQRLSPGLFREIQFLEDPCKRIYYMLFHLIKALKGQTPFKEYREAIYKKTGIQLNAEEKMATEIVFNNYFTERSTCGTLYHIQASPES